MRPAPVAGTHFVDAASELLAAFQEVGALARQELVSCIPPALLDAQPGDVVADLCAAPGMKALQLLDAVGGDGLVVASEAIRKRLAVLVRRARRSSSKGAPALCADARRGRPHAAADRLEALEIRQGALWRPHVPTCVKIKFRA